MAITCPQCGTRYNLSAAQIGPQGRPLKCARCQHQWFVPPVAAVPDADVPPPLPPAPELGLDELAHLGQAPAGGRGRLLGWLLAVLLVLVVALAGAVWWLWQAGPAPESNAPAPLADPQPDDLRLGNLNRELLEDGSLMILRFSGTVTNTGETARPLPEIRLQLLDAKGIEIDFWPAEVTVPVLEPGQSVPWSVRFLNPPLERIASFRAFFKTTNTFTPAPVAGAAAAESPTLPPLPVPGLPEPPAPPPAPVAEPPPAPR